MFKKVLIANRGEIACRIARTLGRMRIAAATVHSEADAGALHVREIGESVLLGPAPARESYLDIDKVIAAARRVGADAVHPGFGFLSENAAFARACAEAGITFIGPAPQALELFGDKAAAKKLAQSLGVPTAGGLPEPTEDVDALLAATDNMPLPFILKAAAGGGGKGMRVVRQRGETRAAVEAAIREGRSSFGDGRLIAERYLPQARHIEVQILGDGQGGVLHLFDRECSLQRRHQKVVEEAPVLSLPQRVREELWKHAVAIGREARYLGLGTVEFAVTPDGAVFLEVNPRLQVEHPVTEAVLGLDLVALQIETVARGALPFTQEDAPAPEGVAVQARLYAEDPARGFLPSTGRLSVFRAPSNVRVDAGVASGSEITPHYDPMVAKLIAQAPTRQEALSRLAGALAETTVLGVQSNREFLVELLADPQVQRNAINTEFLDQWLAAHPPAEVTREQVAACAAAWLDRRRAQQAGAVKGAWADSALTGWHLKRAAEPAVTASWQVGSATAHWQVGFGRDGDQLLVRVDDDIFRIAPREAGAPPVVVDGVARTLRCGGDGAGFHAAIGGHDLTLEFRPLHDALSGGAAKGQGAVRAPMMGIMTGVEVTPGQQVAAGDRLATLESMKMEMAITAPVAGVVAWVGCEARSKVERHQDLFRIEAVT
ncbi:acetyl/propionyl/methylcrotonyl-CoA carboxylase subunit alpha [Ramlibacter humi]|uniref:ATP-grasp domain-containing protein n=1 Tax=Ramlibacter humi TaxID=2530451 RepID=A0A4Z0CAZ3_9BURK|nr:biotin carboxylase N-terminal domain-containing protein [Ramlibacter humi]TFZ08816.1 ATP-grasp domain-containing protein [Ramlibacter humi]